MGRKRPIECKFRLSESEYELLQGRLEDACMNRNTYIVYLITGNTVFPRDKIAELNSQYMTMNRLLRGIGTNINQISKIANSTGDAPAAAALADMYQDVQTLRRNLQPLWDETRIVLWRS